MFWSVSLVWAVILVKCGSVSTYMAIIPGNVPGREYYSSSSTRPTIKADGQSKESEETDTGETFERSLRSDCGRLLRLYNRLHSKSGAYALLAEGQIDGHVLDDCAKFLLTTNRAFPLSSITRDYDSPYWKRALRSFAANPGSDARTLQRRGYDYIRFGKRLMAAANKRMQASSSKNPNKNSGTHEYIRFGKK